MKKTGDPEQARKINTSLILDQLRSKDLISRADLARRLDLSKVTVSAIINELIAKKIIQEVGQGLSTKGGGRKPVLLTLDSSSFFVIGIDIGTTNTVLAAGNLKGQTVHKQRVPTRKDRTVKKVLDQVKCLVDAMMKETGIQKEQIAGIGLSVAGIVKKDRGAILLSPDMGWENVAIKELLEEKTLLNVVADNCTRVMAVGEKSYGAAKDKRNVFYVNVGYGIGSALIVEGEIYNINSEFGHIVITKKEDCRCDCGKYGCLEAVSSGQAIERKANSFMSKENGEWITAEELAGMAGENNEVAIEIFEEAGKYLGRALSIVANLLNPDMIIIGGGVSQARDILMNPVLKEFNKHTMAIIRNTTEITISELGMDAGVLGAIAMGLDRFVFGADIISRFNLL